MRDITTILKTSALYSDDGEKRYLLKKVWDEKKPIAAVIMLAPSEADGIALDSTTMLVLNNASRLGYGGVNILNLFATLNDYALEKAEKEDRENVKIIAEVVKNSSEILYAPGVGKAKNEAFVDRTKQVLSVLKPYEKKMKCICTADGSGRLLHPLFPAVRSWNLEDVTVSEILKTLEPQPKKKSEKKTAGKTKEESKA